MNYIRNFIKYFYGEENNLIKNDFIKEVIDEFYKRYGIRVSIIPKDTCVLEQKSGICELKYNQPIDIMASFKHKEVFTLGGYKICPFGSKRNKDEFYKTVYLDIV